MKSVRIIHTNDIHSKYEEFLRMAYVIEKNNITNKNTFGKSSSQYTFAKRE